MTRRIVTWGGTRRVYEGLGTGFRPEMSVDNDGIAIDPAVARRLFPRVQRSAS
ncbi:MAG TPA: hypothetical protein VNL91_00585 [Thermoanaerobaculia bacterium]|nr:hypothetical protein [Thermoanaerobaculia bacterium]